jgi:hypothetical protein
MDRIEAFACEDPTAELTNGWDYAVPSPLNGKEASAMIGPTGANEREEQAVEPKAISTDEGETILPGAPGPLASSDAVRFYTEALREIARKHGIET